MKNLNLSVLVLASLAAFTSAHAADPIIHRTAKLHLQTNSGTSRKLTVEVDIYTDNTPIVLKSFSHTDNKLPEVSEFSCVSTVIHSGATQIFTVKDENGNVLDRVSQPISFSSSSSIEIAEGTECKTNIALDEEMTSVHAVEFVNLNLNKTSGGEVSNLSLDVSMTATALISMKNDSTIHLNAASVKTLAYVFEGNRRNSSLVDPSIVIQADEDRSGCDPDRDGCH